MNHRIYAIVVVATLAAAGCRSAAPAFCGLERGMSEAEFLSIRLENRCGIVRAFGDGGSGGWSSFSPGGTWDVEGNPVQSSFFNTYGPSLSPVKSLRVADDDWKVWAYHVDRLFVPRGHDEYAVFQNDLLVAWGLGRPPRQILDHPEQLVDK